VSHKGALKPEMTHEWLRRIVIVGARTLGLVQLGR